MASAFGWTYEPSTEGYRAGDTQTMTYSTPPPAMPSNPVPPRTSQFPDIGDQYGSHNLTFGQNEWRPNTHQDNGGHALGDAMMSGSEWSDEPDTFSSFLSDAAPPSYPSLNNDFQARQAGRFGTFHRSSTSPSLFLRSTFSQIPTSVDRKSVV